MTAGNDLERLSAGVMDLDEVVERLTHAEDAQAIPGGRLDADTPLWTGS